jgi:hypothetical protein
MALDTRGLASGFGQGFGLADQYYARQNQQELQGKANDRADRSMEMREQQFGMQMQEAERTQGQRQAEFILGKGAQGIMPNDEEMKFLKENSQYWPAFDPESDAAIENAQRVIDPNDPMDANDPEAIYSMNVLFGGRVNRGEGGKKRIAGMYPGQQEGTVTFDLEVEGEDGRKYNAPMTKNRGVKDDDEILQTPVENLINQVQGIRMLRNPFRSPEGQQTATKILAALRGDKAGAPTKGINMNGFLVDPVTGEQMGDFRTEDQRNGRGGPGGSGNAPADVQTAEWMVANNIAPDRSTAWNMLTEANANPAKYVSDFVNQELKAQESAGVYPGDENFKTTAQMRDNAIESLKVIRSRSRGTGQSEPELDPSLPRDGSAVQQEDGSYSGLINRATQGANPTTISIDDLVNQYAD